MPDPATSRAPCLRLFLEGWDIRPDSPNRTRGAHWSRRQTRARLAKEYMLAALCRRSFAPWPQFLPRAEVRATVYLPPRSRPLDPDNATAALKPLIDALVHHGVLRGDTSKHVSLSPVAFVPARERQPGDVAGVEITVLAAVDGGSESVARGS